MELRITNTADPLWAVPIADESLETQGMNWPITFWSFSEASFSQNSLTHLVASRLILYASWRMFMSKSSGSWLLSEGGLDGQWTVTDKPQRISKLICGVRTTTQAVFIHWIQNTAVYWLHAVTYIWQRTVDDNWHGVTQVAVFHDVFNGTQLNGTWVTGV